MIKDSLWFEFNNELSSDYGIINCNLSSGMLEEPLMAESEIVETEIRGRDEPYLQEIKYKPLEFDVNFAFLDSWTEESLQKVKRWLRKPYYCKLRFSENPNRLYYGLFTGEPKINHNGINQGYFTWHFRCNSPYAYSPIYIDTYDFSASDINYFEFNNLGDIDCLPIVEITKVDALGNISIFNLSNGNKEFGFSELALNEIVEVDCLRRNIKSSLEASAPSIYRYDKLVGDYLNLLYGKNQLQVQGKCLLTIKYEFKFH
jgi:predicted phage tail component-like protein